MLRFDILTIFPQAFSSYFDLSIIKRAQKKKIIKLNVYNLRDFTFDPHKTVDDRPYGGGAGMILKVEPIFLGVKHIIAKTKNVASRKRKIILFSAKAKKSFDQKTAFKYSKLEQIILICGRYEGVDERVAKYITDEEISIGNYVLTGGELPAMVVVDAVTRLLPGAIQERSLREESFNIAFAPRKRNEGVRKEYPQYTRPSVFNPSKFIRNFNKYPFQFKKAKLWKVPKVLLSGNHKEIERWRKLHSGC